MGRKVEERERIIIASVMKENKNTKQSHTTQKVMTSSTKDGNEIRD